MKFQDVVELVEPTVIEQDPETPVLLVTLLSLAIPGLGQAWLGQWSRGMRVFAASATFCFGLGLANVLVAYDAYSVAQRKQAHDITVHTSSKSLWVFTKLWAGFCGVLDALVDSFIGAPGPSIVIVLPLMLVSYLAGGRGFRLTSR